MIHVLFVSEDFMIIKKYELTCIAGQVEEVIITGTSILCIKEIDGRIFLFAAACVNDTKKYIAKLIAIGCNTALDPSGIMKYLGTIIINGFDRHIFLENLVEK